MGLFTATTNLTSGTTGWGIAFYPQAYENITGILLKIIQSGSFLPIRKLSYEPFLETTFDDLLMIIGIDFILGVN